MKMNDRWWTGLWAFAAGLGLATVTTHAREVVLPFDAANFSTPQDNLYLPMAPELTYVYTAEEEDGLILNEITQTAETKTILDVETTVVHDIEWIHVEGVGLVLLEETSDWIAWDNAGNVWYFGEDSTSYEYDEDWNLIGTSNAGSWEAGVDDAEPGILMLAQPKPGNSYKQEFAEDVAEDMGRVTRRNVKVTLSDFEGEETVVSGCLNTREWTPLEPGSVEFKYYAPDIGLVRIDSHHGRLVVTELIAVE